MVRTDQVIHLLPADILLLIVEVHLVEDHLVVVPVVIHPHHLLRGDEVNYSN